MSLNLYYYYSFIQDDDEGHLSVFHCIQDMMSKCPNIFLIHFIRLGVLQKISEMANQLKVVDDQQDDDLIQEVIFVYIFIFN